MVDDYEYRQLTFTYGMTALADSGALACYYAPYDSEGSIMAIEFYLWILGFFHTETRQMDADRNRGQQLVRHILEGH